MGISSGGQPITYLIMVEFFFLFFKNNWIYCIGGPKYDQILNKHRSFHATCLHNPNFGGLYFLDNNGLYS